MDAESTWMPTWHPMDHVSRSLGLFSKNHLFEVGLTQNHWETMASDCSWVIIMIYSILSCMRTCMKKKSLKRHLVEASITCDFTLHSRVCDHTTWFWRCVGTAFGHFLLGSHNKAFSCAHGREEIFPLLLSIVRFLLGTCKSSTRTSWEPWRWWAWPFYTRNVCSNGKISSQTY